MGSQEMIFIFVYGFRFENSHHTCYIRIVLQLLRNTTL